MRARARLFIYRIATLVTLWAPALGFAQHLTPPVSPQGILRAGLCLRLKNSDGTEAQRWCPNGANASKITNASGTSLLTISSAGNITNAVSGSFTLKDSGDATTIGLILDTTTTKTGGTKVLSVRTGGAEKAYVDSFGNFWAPTIYSNGGAFAAYGAVPALFNGNVADGAAAISVKIYNAVTLSTAGAKIVAGYSDNAAATERFNFDKDGQVQLGMNSPAARPACASGIRGKIWYAPGGAGAADTLAVCAKDAADAYAWTNLY